ncbi:MAG: L-aspartate oxidase [Coleofasciculaceae cyanobacterium SM2_1_6]|nr:L-aspartate oxidase [Coleofasciculaceae cyanobacterium SM2_1_6]
METDVLILGSGIAGGTAALQLADAGVSVTVVTRAPNPEESNTCYAQGGIIYQGDDDSVTLLAEDLIRAGAGHSHRAAVEILAEEGPDLVERFLVKRLGVPFDRTDQGELQVIREAAHATPRIVHAADTTGKAISDALTSALQAHPHIQLLTEHTAVDLLTPAHHARDRSAIYAPLSCVGAYLFNQKTGEVISCIAKKTILATGGLGQIYLRTTNPVGARGDGLAMAHRAGARVINCEFVQFHPTTFHHETAPAFLISEAVRGAGARLVNSNGQTFMEKYAPEWGDLAPRDVVARGIHQEMIALDVSHVYLDLASSLPAAKIRHEFPNIYAQCLSYGVDITKEPVPVVPGAHYFCGGVWVDVWGRTTLEHLYAAGEVACTGLHGANRLGSASLLEGLVWGDRAARDILAQLTQQKLCTSAKSYSEPVELLSGHLATDIPPWQNTGSELADPVLISQDMRSIKYLMWNYVGLVRTSDRLRRAIRELRHLQLEIEEFYHTTQLTDGLIGLRNAIQVAILVTQAAWANKTSMGCHYRE